MERREGEEEEGVCDWEEGCDEMRSNTDSGEIGKSKGRVRARKKRGMIDVGGAFDGLLVSRHRGKLSERS